MTNPFHPDDADNIIAPLETFADGWDASPRGRDVSATHARRAASPDHSPILFPDDQKRTLRPRV